MRPGFVTFVTLSGWEPRLAETARRTGLARLVGRCSDFAEVERLRASVVVIGSSSPILGPAVINRWRTGGRVVVVIDEGGDPTLPRRVAGAHAVFAGHAPVMEILMFVAASVSTAEPVTTGRIITVTGPRGSHGRSEVALALAIEISRHRPVHLLDLDVAAPGLGFRLGLPPFARETTLTVGSITFTGFAPTADPISEVVRSRLAASVDGDVVIDAGPDRHPSSGRTVVVSRTDPQSLIRLGRYIRRAEEVAVVANLVDSSSIGDVDRVLGRRPEVIIPRLAEPTIGSPIAGMGERLSKLVGSPAVAAA